MLLRFFRINDPYRLLGLLVVLVLASLPFFIDPPQLTRDELTSFVLGEAVQNGQLMYARIFDSTAPIISVLFGAVDWGFGRSLTARHILALAILFYQASFFAILLIQNKAYSDNSYVPGLIFGLLCFFSFDMLSFSAELIASTLLLFALNNLFKEIEFRIDRDEIILNLGVYLGIATLVVFSYFIFLVGAVIILFLFTRLTVRKLLLLVFGFSLPHALLAVCYFLLGKTDSLWNNFYVPNFTWSGMMPVSFRGILMLCAVPLSYFVFSLFMLNREARFTKYQSQLFQVMFYWLLCCLAQVLISREITPHGLIIFIPSFAYFISHYLLLIRRKWIAESMLWIFLGGLLTVNLAARYGKITSIDYSGLYVPASVYAPQTANSAVMVLAVDPGIYRKNRLGGYFLDWNLSRSVFEEPGYYENVLLVREAFGKHLPDKIIDPTGVLRVFLERLPEVKSQYTMSGGVYTKRVN